MANKKTKPAAGKSAAGKSNSKQNNQKSKQKQRALDEKNARRVLEERQKVQKAKQKKSEELHKRRAKQSEKDKKLQEKEQVRIKRKDKRRHQAGLLKNLWKKVKYYTSKEFLSSFNYFRIFVFIVLPVCLVVFGIIGLTKTVVLNVPSDIRGYEYNGIAESAETAGESIFNTQQQNVYAETLKSSGSGKFEFYMNSVIPIDDNNSTSQLCFGNPSDNDCVLIATVFDKDGKIIYRSLGLESGREINNAKMFTSLSYGLHDAKVAVNAYDRRTNEKIGTRFAKIQLAVGVDEKGN